MDHRVSLIVSSSAAGRLAGAQRFLDGLPPLTEAVLAAPTREAADDLARDLTRRRGAIFGLHRFGFWQLVGRLAAFELARQGLAPATRLGNEALAARATFDASSAGALAYFGPVARCRGFAGTLAATIADLRLARVDPSVLPSSDHGARDLRDLVARYEALLESGRIADRAALLRHATTATREGRSDFAVTRPVVLVDVPIESAAQAELVAALAAAAPCLLATVPSGDTRTVEWLRTLPGAEVIPTPDPQPPIPDPLARLRERLFTFDEPVAAGSAVRPAGRQSLPEGESQVVFFSAPGEGRECVEMARAMRAEAGRGVKFDRMAVLLRAPQLYAGLLETALDRAGIPAWFSHGTSVPDPSGRAFLALLLCATDDLSARRFAEYLSLGQVPDLDPSGAPRHTAAPWTMAQDEEGTLTTPAALPDRRPETLENDPPAVRDTDEVPVLAGTLRAPWNWDRLLVEAAVIGSRNRWARRLGGLVRERQLERDEIAGDEPDSPKVRRLDRDLRDLEHLRRFALPVIDALAALPPAATWGEWLDRLEALAPRVLRLPERVLATLAELRPMAAVGPVALEEVRDVLRDRLTQLRDEPPVRRYGRVFVGTLDELQGRSFDVVFVPGLAERIFPQRPREDPLLLDHVRRAVNDALADGTPPRLPTIDDRVRHERARLQLAAGAARDRLYLSYPRMELSESRPRVPSFYALDVQRAITGRVPDIYELEHQAYETAGARLAWPAPSDPATAIDDAEHDLAVLGGLLHERKSSTVRGRARYLLELSQPLGRSLRARWARWQPKWSFADGLYSPGKPVLDALQRHRLRARPYSVSALQKYATCPYQFLLSAIYRLEPREETVPIERLDPLTRGSLFHRIQAETIRRFDAAKLLPLDESRLGAAAKVLDATLGDVAAQYYDDLAPAIDRVWRDEVESIRGDLHNWLQRLVEQGAVWRPLHTEFGFGFGPGAGRDAASRPDPIALDGGWLLHGVVDLIERDASGRTLRVTDHKTGANRTNEDIVVGNGEVLQPVLYGLAVEAALGTPVAESRLFFCTARGGFTERVVSLGLPERRAGLEVLEIVDRAVELGLLAPAPREGACPWCDFRDVCGPYEERRIRRKDPTPLQDLLQLRAMP